MKLQGCRGGDGNRRPRKGEEAVKKIHRRRGRLVLVTLVVFLGLHNTGDHAYRIDGPENGVEERTGEVIGETFDIGSLDQDLILEPHDTAYTVIPIEEKTMAAIVKKAEEDWPASEAMRDFQIDQQKKALQYLESVEAYPWIKARAVALFPCDYEARKFYYQRQVAALEKLEALPEEWEYLLTDLAGEADYEVLWYTVRQQMEAKAFLQTQGRRHQEILSGVSEKHPGDYLRQLEDFIRQLKAKEFMAAQADSPAKALAREKYPRDYQKQKIQYLDQIY